VLVVRLLIAPAVVTLLGDRAWSLPPWLDRILPNVSLEGHLVQGLDEPQVAAATAEERREAAVSSSGSPR
jgi:putative drug exporter of the RND superfamily